MQIPVAAESDAGEPQAAAAPDTITKMVALGADVAVEPGAGAEVGILDADDAAAGATVLRGHISRCKTPPAAAGIRSYRCHGTVAR